MDKFATRKVERRKSFICRMHLVTIAITFSSGTNNVSRSNVISEMNPVETVFPDLMPNSAEQLLQLRRDMINPTTYAIGSLSFTLSGGCSERSSASQMNPHTFHSFVEVSEFHRVCFAKGRWIPFSPLRRSCVWISFFAKKCCRPVDEFLRPSVILSVYH